MVRNVKWIECVVFLGPSHGVLSVQVSRERTECGWVESQFESAASTCTSGSTL